MWQSDGICLVLYRIKDKHITLLNDNIVFCGNVIGTARCIPAELNMTLFKHITVENAVLNNYV